jgi:hypothetical protein
LQRYIKIFYQKVKINFFIRKVIFIFAEIKYKIMEQLETTKGKSVVIPKIVNRYIVMYYDKFIGWKCEYQVFTTPESATQDYIQRQDQYPNTNILYYKIVEVELEIPFVPK